MRKLLKGKGIDFEIKPTSKELLEDVNKSSARRYNGLYKILGIKPSVFEELNQADIFILPSLGRYADDVN